MLLELRLATHKLQNLKATFRKWSCLKSCRKKESSLNRFGQECPQSFCQQLYSPQCRSLLGYCVVAYIHWFLEWSLNDAVLEKQKPWKDSYFRCFRPLGLRGFMWGPMAPVPVVTPYSWLYYHCKGVASQSILCRCDNEAVVHITNTYRYQPWSNCNEFDTLSLFYFCKV